MAPYCSTLAWKIPWMEEPGRLQSMGSSLSCHFLLHEGNGNPLQYSCLENPMDGGAWKAAVHGVAEGRTQLSDFTFTFHLHASEKDMATHSSVLALRILGTGEPGGLLSMGSHRVGHDWSDLAAAAAVLLGPHGTFNTLSYNLPFLLGNILNRGKIITRVTLGSSFNKTLKMPCTIHGLQS